MIGAVLAAFWSHWRRNRLQLATLIAGIALATALWTGVQAINAEARASMDTATRAAAASDLARLERADGARFSEADFVALRRAGVLVTPVLQGAYEVAPGLRLRLTGLDPLTAPADLWPGGPLGPAGGDPDAVFVPPATPAAPGLVARPEVPEGQAFADIATAQRLLGRTGFDAFLLTPPQPLGAPAPQGVIAGVQIVPPATATAPAALTQSFRLNLTAFGALCFVVGLFIVRGTIGLALAQRRRTMTILRALGAPAGLLGLLTLAELTLIATLSGVLGVGLGYVLALSLMPGVSATLDGIYGAEIGSGVALRPVWWLGGLAMAIIGTLLSAAGPMLRAAGQPVLGPARGLPLRWLSLAGVLLLGVSAALVLWAQGLLAGFAAIAALLLGGAALMPGFLGGLLAVARRCAHGPLAEWTLAETRAQIPQMALAMTALMMALAANIGVSTMVDSFRQSFSGFIDQRLAAEIYVATPDGGAALREILEPGTRLLPMRWQDASLAGQPSEIYGIVDDPTYRGWSLLAGGPDAWDALERDGAIINEQLHHRTGLSLGAKLLLPDGPAMVVGIIADYGNPLGKAYVSEARLDSLAPGLVATRHAIRTDNADALRRRLLDAGIPPDRIALQSEVKAASLRIFERTFAVTAALNALMLTVAGFAVLTSLLAFADARLPRLTPLWAMGLDRRHLALLELGRVALTAALTALLALPLGIALSWLLLAVINVEAFGWRLPFRADPGGWLALITLGCAAAVLAALWPAWRLARISPRALTEVLTNDG